jgi:SPP1 family phage portal protein
MTAQDVDKIIDSKGFKEILTLVENQNPIDEDVLKKNIAEYKGTHKILMEKNKIIGKDGATKIVETAKLVISLQKKIVRSAVAFLFGEPVSLVLDGDEEEPFQALKQVWEDNKLDYFNKKVCRKTVIETRAAELWYIADADGVKTIKSHLLSEGAGDGLFPYYDEYGDMNLFLRTWVTKDAKKSDVNHATLYHADKTWTGISERQGEWIVTTSPQPFMKIPIIYYQQETSEWADSQTLIDRLEKLVSKHADTNDYFASPAVVAKGIIENPPEKDEVGKFFQISMEQSDDGKPIYGNLEYLTWDQTPESIKLEFEQLKELIYSMTSTPDISFNNIKGTGSVSGIALQFMFMDAIQKAQDNEELYGAGIARRLNLIKRMMATLNISKKQAIEGMKIKVEFKTPLPQSLIEEIDALSTARAGTKIISLETAVARNPLVNNPQEEVDRIQAEDTQAVSMGESFI